MKIKLIFTVLFFICMTSFLISCSDSSKNNNKDNSSDTVIVSEPDIDKIIENLDKKHEDKIYGNFSDEVGNRNDDEKKETEGGKNDDFQYSIEIKGIGKYEKISPVSIREISQYTMNTLDIQLVGFSDDSKFLIYELSSKFYVMDLYQEDMENSVIFESTSKEAAKSYVESSIQDLLNYDLSINEYIKNNLFWFTVDKFSSEGKKGFYVSLYSINSNVKFSIFSRRIDEMDKMGNISEIDIYFSPDRGWAVIHPFFDEYNYDYGFLIVNIREHYSKVLKKEAINNYNEGDYKTSLTKYRQSLFLAPGTPETYYNCAVLIKSLDKKESEYMPFVKKAILLNSKLIPRAKKDGFIE